MTKICPRVAKSINNDLAKNNIAYYKSLSNIDNNICYLAFNGGRYVKIAKKMSHPSMLDNYIYLNGNDRIILNAALDEQIEVVIVPEPIAAASIFISVSDKSKINEINTVTDLMEKCLKDILIDTVANKNTIIGFLAPELYHAKILSIADKDNNDIKNGYINQSTEIIIINTEKKTLTLNIKSINYEKIGVGGLQKEFTELVKSIFVTRIIPEKIYKKMNIKHTKGAILYGPPGCGKTRIARQIGTIIGCKNIRVINGPELLSKYVGEAEKNIRECFEIAKKKPDEMHLLIFDEFDAIAGKRTGGENNHTDKVVGQLLTMLDGVEEINNMIVFALTNRIDIIDQAILRPGRFGVHIKIGLPDLMGRYEILKIHSKDLIENNLFNADMDLKKVAEETDCYTGAELESLVQSTVQHVVGQQIDFDNIVESAKKIENVTIGLNDFKYAITKISPMFKNKSKIYSDLGAKIIKPLSEADFILINELINHINSTPYTLVTCIIGKPKSGKTSIVCKLATDIGIENIEYISAHTILSMPEKSKIDYITNAFNSIAPTLIILDGIEMIIEYVSEVIFNRNILHTIKVLLNTSNHNVVITTSYYDTLRQMTILDSVQHTVNIS